MKPIGTLSLLLPFSLVIAFLAAPVLVTVAADEKITYQDHILPLLENKCLNCHNPDEAKGGLDLSTYGAAMTGGSGGEVAIAQDPLGSRIYSLMAHREEPYMPPKKPKASDEELKLVTAWIDGGLLETASSKARKSDKPKLELNLLSATGKPEGPPPMPEHLLLQPQVVTEHAPSIPAMAHSPWAPIVAIAGQKQVLLYNSEDFELLGVLPYPEGFPQTLSFSSNGSLLVCGGGRGGKSGNVVAWDVKTGERVIEVGKEFDIVLGADISPDYKQVVLGGPGRNVKIWDTVTGEQVNSIKKHPDWLLCADYSPDGVLFATGGRNADLYVWEGATGYEFYTLKGHTLAVTDLAWRADSNVLASCSEDGQIILWEMGEGKEVKKWNAHGGGVLSVDFAPDGKIVSGGRDKTVKIWKPDGSALSTINASDDIVMTVAFSQDSKRVISGDFHGKIAVWNADNGAKLAELNPNPGTIDQQLAYSQKRITELTTNLPKLEEGVKAVSKEMADARAKLDAASKAAAEAAGKKSELDKTIAGLNNQIKSLAEQEKPARDALAARQADAKKKTDAFNAVGQARTAAQNEVNKWKGEFTKAEAAAKAAAGDPAATKNAADLKAKLDAANKQLAEADAKAKPLQDARTAADAEVKKAADALAAKTKALADARAQLAAAGEELKKAAPLAESAARQKEAAEKAVQAVAQKEAEAKKNIELAKNELETSKYLVQKWQAAAVNLQVKEESEQLGDLEEKLEGIKEQVAEKKTEYEKASSALAEAEKTLASARKTVADGTQKLAENTTTVLETILELASAKAAAGIREGAAGKATAEPAKADKPAEGKPAAEATRETLEKELQDLRSRLASLESIIQKNYQEATQTRQVVEKATQVASTAPKTVAERAKAEDAIESEMKKALTEKEKHEAEVAAQRQRIEELRKKYLEMLPKKEG